MIECSECYCCCCLAYILRISNPNDPVSGDLPSRERHKERFHSHGQQLYKFIASFHITASNFQTKELSTLLKFYFDEV